MPTDIERLAVLIEANTKSYENAMAKFQQRTDSALRNVEKRFQDSSRKLESMFGGLGVGLQRAMGMLGVGLSVRELQRFADQFTSIQNALKVTGLEGEELNRVYRRLFESAQANAAPLGALSTLYGRAALVQKELKVSTEELLQFTDRIALALRVSGQSAEQSSGALLQLSQALGSGVVRAEEFNSILEGALPIAQAAAAGIDEAGGSVSKLRTLITSGKVSSEAFFKAFQAGSTMLEARAAGMEMTIGQAFTQFQNVLIDAIGGLDRMTGTSRGVIKSIQDLSDALGWISRNLDTVKGSYQEVATAIRGVGNEAKESSGWLSRMHAWAKLLGSLTPGGAAANAVSYAAGRIFGSTPAPGANAKSDAPTATPDIKPVRLADYPVQGKKDGKNTVGVDSFERAVAQAQKRIMLLEAETATLGQNTAARERAKIVAELETAAKNANAAAGLKNTEVTDAQRQKIEQMADAMQHAAQRNDDLTKQIEAQNSALRFAGEQTIDLINAIGGTAEERANALKNVLNQLIQALMRAAILGDGPLAGILGMSSKTGGVGGLFGLLSKGFGGFFADGGTMAAGKWGIVGERGPEIISSGPRPVHVSPMSGGGGRGVQIVQNLHFEPGMSGTDRVQVAAAMAQMEQNIYQRVPALLRERARNDPHFYG